MDYLITSGLICQPGDKERFIKGAHTSYAMIPPRQVEKNSASIEALAQLKLTMIDYQKGWQQCLLAAPELSAKMERPAIHHINLYLDDYIPIIHRLGSAYDPIAQKILKPGLLDSRIGIDFHSNTFSLMPEHIIHFDSDDDVMEKLKTICVRPNGQKSDFLNDIRLPIICNLVCP